MPTTDLYVIISIPTTVRDGARDESLNKGLAAAGQTIRINEYYDRGTGEERVRWLHSRAIVTDEGTVSGWVKSKYCSSTDAPAGFDTPEVPTPVGGNPTYEEAGRALATLVRFIKSLL